MKQVEQISLENMKRVLFICLTLLLIAGGCKSTKTAASFSDLQGEWAIVELNGNKLVPEVTKQRLRFDTAGRRLSGNAGCNLLSGSIVYGDAQKNGIRFKEVVSTQKACLDMRLEDEFLQVIDKVVRFDVQTRDEQGKTIAFYDTDNRKLFVISTYDGKE
jgi:heat shock protein HslJ